MAIYFLKFPDVILSGNFKSPHKYAISCSSVLPVKGASADGLAKTYGLLAGIPTILRVSTKISTETQASGSSKMKASTFFLDFPEIITMSILDNRYKNIIQPTDSTNHHRSISHPLLCKSRWAWYRVSNRLNYLLQ